MNSDISQYRWKNRLVYAMTNNNTNELFIRFNKDYEKHKDAVIERRLVKKIIVREKLQPTFQIVLYTLDGKLHKRIKQYKDFETFLKEVDSMPLRKREIKKKIKTIRV